MEEGLRQAAKSLSDERREHIASLIANSLTTTAMSFAESRHLLRVLGEVNDIEIIRLASHQYQTQGSGEAFWEKHRAVLEPINATFGSSQEELDRHTMHTSYDAHLQQLGLLSPRFNVNRNTGQVQVGTDGDLEITSHSLSAFGHLLLRQLGLLDPDKSD